MNIVSGSRYLGGCIGEKEVVHDFVKDKVGKWVDSINNLTKAAHKYPQAVYSCFTKSLQCEWNYLQRVVPGCDDLYEELKTTINQVLIPAIFGREVLQREYELLELPVRIGGMALKDPVKTASTNFNNSSNATVIMQHAIKTGDKLNVHEHNDDVEKVLKVAKHFQAVKDEVQADAVIESFPQSQKRVIKRVVDGKASSWLSVLPVARDGYDLTAQQFCDNWQEDMVRSL